jgi:hypothetical protein
MAWMLIVEPIVDVCFGVVALAGAVSRASPAVSAAAVVRTLFMFFNVWAKARRPSVERVYD